MNGRPWTTEEDQLIRDNPDALPGIIGDKINRTPASVARRKSQLGVKCTERHCATGRKKEEWEGETDERPSGWYIEMVGTLLLDYEDAFSSWKHFHRYVEVKRTGLDDRRGWTTLLCKRDADAP